MFLNQTVGSTCKLSSTNYMAYGGDNIDSNGTETVPYSMDKARKAGLWSKLKTILIRGAWFGDRLPYTSFGAIA